MEIRVKEMPSLHDSPLPLKIETAKRVTKTLRCVFCHDDVLEKSCSSTSCLSCGACFHNECRELFYGQRTCPTLGCGAKLETIERVDPIERQAFSFELEFLWKPWTLSEATVTAVSIGFALCIAVIVTSALLGFGFWLFTFPSALARLLGAYFIVGSFFQSPFSFIYPAQWLSTRLQPRSPA